MVRGLRFADRFADLGTLSQKSLLRSVRLTAKKPREGALTPYCVPLTSPHSGNWTTRVERRD